MKQFSLRPIDVGVALGLIEYPNASYQQLHELLGISCSTAHEAVGRLREAGLVRQDECVVMRANLLEFLEYGVRYAFPASLGAPAKGVPTSHAGPALADAIGTLDAVVWPSANGSSIGQTVSPLLPKAAELPVRSPKVYALLTLVDALRVGRIRERRLAVAKLRTRMYGEPTASSS
jgi:DNA-binding Lrp family transcriptional regulator